MPSYRDILQRVQEGTLSVDDATVALRRADVEELGFASLDLQRRDRKGFAEVVYCEGKTPEQSAIILERLANSGEGNVLGTRANQQTIDLLHQTVPDALYDEMSRTIVIRRGPQQEVGLVTVVAAGTSDLPVAEEAAITAAVMGNRVERIYDVGVAGIHRLLRRLEDLRSARVLIAVAGMEGALVSVLTGLVDKPVIGVPTSVGYGAQLHGLTPLMSMLTSCVPGMAVVNIDNGFGAGYMASLVNQMGGEGRPTAEEQ